MNDFTWLDLGLMSQTSWLVSLNGIPHPPTDPPLKRIDEMIP